MLVSQTAIFFHALADDAFEFGRELRISRIGGIGARSRIALKITPELSPANGNWPVAASYRTTPNENKSDREPRSVARTCSGDIGACQVIGVHIWPVKSGRIATLGCCGAHQEYNDGRRPGRWSRRDLGRRTLHRGLVAVFCFGLGWLRGREDVVLRRGHGNIAFAIVP